MAKFFGCMVKTALVVGAAAFVYECVMDEETRERANKTVQEAVSQASAVAAKVSDAVQNVSLEDIQDMATNNAWISKQWHDIGY